MARLSSNAAIAFAGCVAVVLALHATSVDAKQSPEEKCQKGRYAAAAKYAACEQNALGKYFGGDDFNQAAVSKCRVTYAAAWPKLQTAARKVSTVETCDAERFTVNVDGTVTDELTGLQWEQKTDDGGLHDKDNFYSWSAAPSSSIANGTAFTTFLAALNDGGCFAGHCDWRLPTLLELQTILAAPFPCATGPCVDQTAFGPTSADAYWSATTVATTPDFAWLILFDDGNVFFNGKFILRPVRAVRGGL